MRALFRLLRNRLMPWEIYREMPNTPTYHGGRYLTRWGANRAANAMNWMLMTWSTSKVRESVQRYPYVAARVR